MRLLFSIGIFLTGTHSFAFEIGFKNNVNMRSIPKSFFGSDNVFGSITAGAKATVMDEILLPSGIKAYKISLDSIIPKSNLHFRIKKKDAWVYGSPKLVDRVGQKANQEAQVISKRCAQCRPQDAVAMVPIKKIVQHMEVEDSKEDLSDDAKTMIDAIKNKGFSCDIRPEQIQLRGVQCRGNLDGYPNKVRLYIPKNFQKSSQNKINIFFHGLKSSSSRIFEVNSKDRNGAGDFGGRLAESGNTDTIVVVPESEVQGEGKKAYQLTYRQYFEDGTGKNFNQFENQISALTGGSFPELSLSGHSAGYSALNSLLGYPEIANKINRVALFDGTYNRTTNISSWLNGNPKNKMLLSWTTQGEVASESANFASRVKNSQQLRQVPTKGEHMDNIRDGGFSDFLKGL